MFHQPSDIRRINGSDDVTWALGESMVLITILWDIRRVMYNSVFYISYFNTQLKGTFNKWQRYAIFILRFLEIGTSMLVCTTFMYHLLNPAPTCGGHHVCGLKCASQQIASCQRQITYNGLVW